MAITKASEQVVNIATIIDDTGAVAADKLWSSQKIDAQITSGSVASMESIGDVDAYASGAAGYVSAIKSGGSGIEWVPNGSASSLQDIGDIPSYQPSAGGTYLVLNAAGDTLTWETLVTTIASLEEIGDVSAYSTGAAGDFLTLNGTTDGAEWTNLSTMSLFDFGDVPNYTTENNKYLQVNPAGTGLIWSDPSGAPGGAATNVQYNDGAVLAGDANFTYDWTTQALTVVGNISAATFSSTSSIKFKENVETLSEEDANKVLSLRGVRFDWKENGLADIGMIAEEVNEVFPEFVKKKGDGTVQGLDYGRIVSALIEVVKNQQAQINDLKERL